MKCENNKTKILLIFRFFHYVWFDSENSSFILILKEKMKKALTFNIVHFTNFEISSF